VFLDIARQQGIKTGTAEDPDIRAGRSVSHIAER
jgi:hypothetical protein